MAVSDLFPHGQTLDSVLRGWRLDDEQVTRVTELIARIQGKPSGAPQAAVATPTRMPQTPPTSSGNGFVSGSSPPRVGSPASPITPSMPTASGVKQSDGAARIKLHLLPYRKPVRDLLERHEFNPFLHLSVRKTKNVQRVYEHLCSKWTPANSACLVGEGLRLLPSDQAPVNWTMSPTLTVGDICAARGVLGDSLTLYYDWNDVINTAYESSLMDASAPAEDVFYATPALPRTSSAPLTPSATPKPLAPMLRADTPTLKPAPAAPAKKTAPQQQKQQTPPQRAVKPAAPRPTPPTLPLKRKAPSASAPAPVAPALRRVTPLPVPSSSFEAPNGAFSSSLSPGVARLDALSSFSRAPSRPSPMKPSDRSEPDSDSRAWTSYLDMPDSAFPAGSPMQPLPLAVPDMSMSGMPEVDENSVTYQQMLSAINGDAAANAVVSYPAESMSNSTFALMTGSAFNSSSNLCGGTGQAGSAEALPSRPFAHFGRSASPIL